MIHELSGLNPFKPFPAYADRKAWIALPEEFKTLYISEAEKIANEEWESLPATMYLDFVRNGNRSRYERRCFNRRNKVITLLLAECIEGKGRFLDAIINGVWLIAEETSWEVAAHLNLVPKNKRDELPDIEEQMPIDIYPADTGILFSLVYYFLGDVIAVETPVVKRRIEIEVERRLLTPYLKYDNYFWDNGPVIHNHNTWTNEDMLVCYLTFSQFPRALEGVNKCIRSINKLLNHYPEDGGCDEGPSYYDKAAGAVIDIIETLSMVTDVSYLWKTPKIRNMAAYIYHAYIGGDYFVNYADASPRIKWGSAVLERAGRYLGDETLLRFVAYQKALGNGISDTAIHRYSLFRDLITCFDPEKSRESGVNGGLFKPPAASWYPGMETVYAREPWTEKGPEGFFFSAKGHHNRVNHNHNDCGNFILYLDAKPVIIDAGVEAYTSKTFGPDRYSLWTMRSLYHNVPTINNAEQEYGLQYRAKDVFYSKEGSVVKFSLDIAGAYPEKAETEYYKREFVFDKELMVTDRYRLKTWKAPLELNLLCYDKPEIEAAAGKIGLSGSVGLDYGAAALDTAIDEIRLEDPKIRDDWQKDSIFRLRLILRGQDREGIVSLRFFRS